MIRTFNRILTVLASVAVLFTSQTLLAQSETAATVPASFLGTYTTTYDQVNSGGPFSAGEEVIFVLRSDNTLCINGLELANPVHVNGNPAEAIWTDEDNGYAYAVSNFESDFNELNIAGPNFSPFYGQLVGSKTSESQDCSGSSANPEVTAEMNSIFELAESKLSEFFPAGVETRFLDQYVYRYYPATGVYLAFADGNVLLLGGAFGDVIVDAGTVSFVLETLEVYEPLDVGGNVELWDLTISGSFDTSFIQGISFSGLTLNDIPAPELDDLDEIEDSIITSLDGVATGISSISITVDDNSENRRAFTASFSATTEAGSVTYNLTYVYTR